LKKYSPIKKSIFILDTESQNIPDNELINIYKNQNEIIDIAQAYERYLYRIPVDYVSKSWIIQNINPRQNVLYKVSARIIEIAIAIIILVITSPFLLVSAIFIYLEDKGPVIYTQQRVGLNGETFKIFKLRSIIVHTEEDGAIWLSPEDKRITKIGRIIRKTHLDEIPQMVNIIKGELALFGPRPERPEFTKELEKSIPYYQYRHIIRPGFTGWAQIKFKYANSVMTSKEKFEYDLYYIKNKNIFMDFGIFLRTVQILFTRL
jgi:lipopolysaccharide/colanic/teichoic acid biosynthesis glycosyltransferase